MKAIPVMFGTTLLLPSLYQNPPSPNPNDVPMKDLASRAGLPRIGALLGGFDNGIRGDVMKFHFNSGTTAISWGDHVTDYDPSADTPGLNLAWTKWVADFGRQNGMETVVNHLIFAGSVRDWFTRAANQDLTESEFRPFFVKVIRAMIAELTGRIDVFSVVNEPWYPESGRPTDPFRDLLGSDYIRLAHETARAALSDSASNAKTSFSETFVAYTNDATRETVSMLLQDDLVDELFLQAHDMNGSLEQLQQAVAWIDSLAVPWRISEITGTAAWIADTINLAVKADNCIQICFWEDPNWAPNQTLMEEDGALTERFYAAYDTLAALSP